MSQQINLYEERLRPRREIATARNVGLATLAALVVMGAWAISADIDAQRQEAAAAASLTTLAAAQANLKEQAQLAAQRKVTPALAQEVEAAKARLALGTDVLGELESGRLGQSAGFSAFMTGFAQQAQDGLWLTGFRVTDGGNEIEIRGRLLDPARLPNYVQRLNGVPAFQGRRFASLNMRSVTPDDGAADGRIAAATGSGAPAAVPQGPSAQVPAAPRPVAYTEFVLRSEHVGDGAPTTEKGAP